jgi:protein phosphatase
VSEFDFDGRRIVVKVAGRTDVGQRRRENQDSFLVAEFLEDDEGQLLEPDVETGGPVGSEFTLGPKGALCLVADGMGGAAAGGLAANVAVQCIHDEMRRNWVADRVNTPRHFAQRLKEAVEASNSRIHGASLADPNYRGMGTTATAVGLLESFLYVAQVGDSRAYMVRNSEAVQLTRDQSYIQHLVDSGAITEEEAEKSDHRNMILQALGTSPYVDVDLTFQEVRRGDIVIVCSDGLSKVVSRTDISDVANRAGEPAGICDELVDLANLRGGPDNITVLAARFDGMGLDEPGDEDTVGHRVFTIDRG